MTLDTVTEFLRIISGLFAILGVPMLFSAARTLKRMGADLSKHGQTLYGETGANGLRSDVKQLGATAATHASTLQDHGWEISDLKECFERLEKAK